MSNLPKPPDISDVGIKDIKAYLVHTKKKYLRYYTGDMIFSQAYDFEIRIAPSPDFGSMWAINLSMKMGGKLKAISIDYDTFIDYFNILKLNQI